MENTASISSSYCRQCGGQVDPDGKFCKHCGAELKKIIEEVSTGFVNTPPSSKKSNKVGYFGITAGMAGLLIITGIGIYLYEDGA